MTTADVLAPYRPLPFGKKYSVKPRNVADIKPRAIVRFTLDALRGTGVLDLIESRVNFDTGRPRRLRVDVLFSAGIANAAGKQSDSHVRGIQALLAALDPGEQRLLSVRWRDPNRGGEKVITERQVAYLFEQVAFAFNPQLQRHNHVFELDGDLWSPDGEFVAPVREATVEADTFDCTSDCPRGKDMEEVFNAILHGLWSHSGLPLPTEFALDSSVVETHNVTRGHGPKANIDPNWVQGVDKDLVDGRLIQIRQDKRPKWRTDALAEQVEEILANAPAPEPRDPKSRAPIPAGPVVSGDFTRMDPRFPQLGPDGRLVWTHDEGARNAYRGGGNFRRSEVLNGRDEHKLISSGHFPDGTPYPPLVAAYHAVPGGDHKGEAALAVFGHAADNGLCDVRVQLDRIYTELPAQEFELRALDLGFDLVKDLKSQQRVRKAFQTGVDLVDGAFFTDGMPERLLDLPRPSMNANSLELTASQRRFDQRRPFMFRPSGHTSAGGLKMRGPAVPDQVIRDAKGRPISVRGVRARCVNSPFYKLVDRTLVTAITTCKKGEPCGCSLTFTISRDEMPSSYEPLLWGSTKWAKAYYRRNLSEADFSVTHHHYGLGRHSIRVHARKWNLAYGFIALAAWIRQLYSLVMKQGAHALDAGYYSGLDPDVIAYAVKLLTTPKIAPRRKSSDPPT